MTRWAHLRVQLAITRLLVTAMPAVPEKLHRKINSRECTVLQTAQCSNRQMPDGAILHSYILWALTDPKS